MENPEPKKQTFSSILNSMKENKTALIRMWISLAIIYIVGLLLGIGFFLIAIGAFFAIKRFMIYWPQGRKWLVNMFDLKIHTKPTQNKSVFYQRLISIYQITISLVYVLIGSFIIKLGVDILLQNGFLGQNLIYSIFFK